MDAWSMHAVEFIYVWLSSQQYKWQKHFNSSQEKLTVLQEKLEKATKQIQDQDFQREHLQSDVQVLTNELDSVKNQRDQSFEKANKVSVYIH